MRLIELKGASRPTITFTTNIKVHELQGGDVANGTEAFGGRMKPALAGGRDERVRRCYFERASTARAAATIAAENRLICSNATTSKKSSIWLPCSKSSGTTGCASIAATLNDGSVIFSSRLIAGVEPMAAEPLVVIIRAVPMCRPSTMGLMKCFYSWPCSGRKNHENPETVWAQT